MRTRTIDGSVGGASPPALFARGWCALLGAATDAAGSTATTPNTSAPDKSLLAFTSVSLRSKTLRGPFLVWVFGPDIWLVTDGKDAIGESGRASDPEGTATFPGLARGPGARGKGLTVARCHDEVRNIWCQRAWRWPPVRRFFPPLRRQYERPPRRAATCCRTWISSRRADS